ncbi:unnamed protein product [Ilex paraguariensis]|uniref:Uncharacterized protein n=1 Tax=Ilex paraguariensis TaxID=185542 RepID=A0ABC8V3P4_9AQUA
MLAAPMVHVFLEKEEDSLWEAMLEKIGQAITMAPMDLVASPSLDTPFARLAAWVMMGAKVRRAKRCHQNASFKRRCLQVDLATRRHRRAEKIQRANDARK